MENKYQTLRTIFDLVKNDADPTSSVLYPNEIIVRQKFAWDEIVKNLEDLRSENLIRILQHSPAVIFITAQGVQFILSDKKKPGSLMYAA